MNKLTFAFVLAVLALVCSSQVNSLPLGAEELHVVEGIQEGHIRVRRFTCDVLGFEVAGSKLNSAACGVHCLALGKSGGYCNSRAICVCR